MNENRDIHNVPFDKKNSYVLSLESISVGILIGLITLFLALGTLNYFDIIQLSAYIPVFSFLPQQQQFAGRDVPGSSAVPFNTTLVNTNNTMTCSEQLQKYQKLLKPGSQFTANGVSVGTFAGLLDAITQDQQSQTITIQVTDGKTSYAFVFYQSIVHIYNLTTEKLYSSLSLVPLHHNIELTYNCDPQAGNIFNIVQINIVP